MLWNLANVELTDWLAAQAPGGEGYQDDPESSQREYVAAGRQFGDSTGQR